jgi:hypothetical protein
MRPLLMAFLILSPFIAIAQNYHLHAAVPILAHAPAAHLAHEVVSNVSTKMDNMLHAVQDLLS